MKKERCALCGKVIEGYGNNGLPLVDGRVCDDCNYQVIIERLLLMAGGKSND